MDTMTVSEVFSRVHIPVEGNSILERMGWSNSTLIALLELQSQFFSVTLIYFDPRNSAMERWSNQV